MNSAARGSSKDTWRIFLKGMRISIMQDGSEERVCGFERVIDEGISL